MIKMLASKSLIMSARLSNYCRRLVLRQRVMVSCPHVVSTPSVRACSAAVIAPPHVEGDDKTYPAKIQKIVEDIGHLTLLEVADLNELLKKTLNISEAPVMAVGGPVAAVAKEEEDVEPKKEKISFNVKLVKIEDGKKIQLIKEIKNLISGMNLVQAKKFVESIPQVVKADLPKDEAEKLKEVLIAAGGQVEID